MTISKEERAEWREMAEYRAGKSVPGTTHEQVVRLLDALESAEARAEAAEREREVLAQALWERGHIMGSVCAVDLSVGWLEWARQQARGEGKE